MVLLWPSPKTFPPEACSVVQPKNQPISDGLGAQMQQPRTSTFLIHGELYPNRPHNQPQTNDQFFLSSFCCRNTAAVPSSSTGAPGKAPPLLTPFERPREPGKPTRTCLVLGSRLKLTLWGWTPPVVDTECGALRKSYKMARHQEMWLIQNGRVIEFRERARIRICDRRPLDMCF